LGNPSSLHQEGRKAKALLEEARRHVADFLGAEAEEVVFTSSGSEANLMALWGLARELGGPAGVTLALSAVEHPSLFAAAESLVPLGARLLVLPVDSHGQVVREALATLPKPAVLCLQLANQETGVLQPVAEVAGQLAQRQLRIHCDAVQGAGRVAFTFRQLGVDTLAVSGHKLGGFAGAGALVVRRGLELPALLPGEQEKRRRGGTEPLLAACSMGWACQLLQEKSQAWETVARLRDEWEQEALARGLVRRVFSQKAPRVPNTSCVALPPSLLGQVAVAALDLQGIAVSSGPACSSGASQESAVVKAMGFAQEASRVLRVSLGLTTTREEMRFLLEALARLCKGGAAEP
jgi:cysteine desulfurase